MTALLTDGLTAAERGAGCALLQKKPSCSRRADKDCEMFSGQIGVLIGSRFRAAIQTVGVGDPVGAVNIYATPLVRILALVNVFIGNAQNVQAKADCAGAAGAGSRMQHTKYP